MSDTTARSITTVTGSIPAEDLGVTLPHEHIHCDFSKLSGSEDYILADTSLTIRELAYFRAAGGRSVIDVTPEGTGRNPAALRAISEASGVQIVCGIGLYDQRSWPAWASGADAGRIADRFVQEVEAGSGGICAGVIGEIQSHDAPFPDPSRYRLDEREETLFIAAARAQRRTGVAVITHAAHGRGGHAQLDILEGAGADLERVAIGHCDAQRHADPDKDFGYFLPMLRRGALCAFDLIGWTESVSDEVRADWVAELIRMGHERQILLSTDTCRRSHLHANGGRGYDYLWTSFLPRLLRRGVTQAQIESMLVAAPRRLLAGDPKPCIADFSPAKRQRPLSEEIGRDLDYWKKQLAGHSGVLDLPTDRPRPPVRTGRTARYTSAMPPDWRHGVSLLGRIEYAMPLLAAFYELLHRYTGQTDLIIGMTAANLLPLRVDLSGDLTFRELVSRVRDVTLSADAHRDVPFETLVEELQPERDSSRNPLVQVTFTLSAARGDQPQTQSLAAAPAEFEAGTAGLDLSLNVIERPEALHTAWDYRADLWDEPTIARLAGHFWTLLAAAVAEPDRRLSELSLLTEAERRQMLIEWNRTAADFPSDKCVHELFEEQAARDPDAPAVVHRDEQLTRGRLNARANQLAHHLRSLGIGRDTPVAICVRRSLDMVVGVLGILKAGGAYVPLDPAFPRERMAYMLRDAGAQTLITQEEFLPRFRDYPGRVVVLDSERSVLAAQPESNPEEISRPEDLIYIIYTSGTTGRPKGILISHRGVVNFLQFLRNTYDLGERDTILLLPSVAWDGSVDDLFLPLVMGGRLVIPTDDEATDPEALLRHVEKQKVTALLSVVPAMLRALTAAKSEGEHPTDSLRLLIVAGEAWFVADYRNARAAFGQDVLIANHYGPTECTCTQVFYPVRTPPAEENGVMCIGRPTPNHELYILDGHRQPVPVGVPGEICIGGVGLARGYVNLPELTAEKFMPHPFSGQPGSRLYRTGDRGRYRSDGNVEFLGRMDHQVKLRGFRIELGEIMTVLGRHPGVRQSVIVRWEQKPGDAHLVAYVIASRQPPPMTGELREFLQRELPEYMVPSVFMFMDRFPLGPTGKVDQRALPAPDRSRAERAYVAPRTPIEKMMAAIWAKVLRVSRVGLEDNFFELGGHSLLATQVISRLREQLGVEISHQQFFEKPTVAGLSLIVAHRLAELASPQDVDSMLSRLGRGQ